MMVLSFLVLAVVPVSPPAVAQEAALQLRQGNYHTPEQARAELAAIQNETPDLRTWQERAARVRRGILRGAGLEVLPARNPLRPIFGERREYDGYSVANVAFEALPGYFVSGNLYRPSHAPGSYGFAAVLCPHGHFRGADGGGRFRPDMQIRCATLARMGAVVFAYDMVGWGESTQYPHQDKALTLQIWNSMRAVDFLTGLDHVDAERVGITGASGGGTQSFLLAALDDRIQVSVPTVMVSAHFFGGCDCESGLPIHVGPHHRTNNAEIAALCAPRAQLLISNGQDWTANTPEVEFPFLQRVYGLFQAEKFVQYAHFAAEGHDYGPSKRQAAYRFFAQHLGLSGEGLWNADATMREDFVTLEDPSALRVFSDANPRPAHAVESREAVEALLQPPALSSAPVHFGNGVKIGEVDHDSALVWIRLTAEEQPRSRWSSFQAVPFANRADAVPEGLLLEDMQGSLVGAAGEVRVQWQPVGYEPNEPNGTSSEGNLVRDSGWLRVDPAADFTRHLSLTDLLPECRYYLKIAGRPLGDPAAITTMEANFGTSPSPDQQARVMFTVVTGQDYLRVDDSRSGHRIYRSMLDLDPDFFVHTGDTVYYDKPGPFAKSLELARYKWNLTYAFSNQREFHRRVPSYFLKDDHDTLKDDCWPGQNYGALTWEQGLSIFREQVPMGESTYRTRRWGEHLQVWMVEGRDYRSDNSLPDGPDKSIWGAQQLAWLQQSMRASDATFRVLISPTPLVGPDRISKRDNHANRAFRHEGDQVRAFLASLDNTVVVCGDRHWQYVSVDPETGLREYSCGPTSDAHAGGYLDDKPAPMHEFLRVKGGFLSVMVVPRERGPELHLVHHSTLGHVEHADILKAVARD